MQMTGNRICSRRGIQFNLMFNLFWDVLSITIYLELGLPLAASSSHGPVLNPKDHLPMLADPTSCRRDGYYPRSVVHLPTLFTLTQLVLSSVSGYGRLH
jgi:hypothetical protein